MSFARATKEAELRIVGNVDNGAVDVGIVGNGGLSIRFLVKFEKFWGDFGRA